MPKVIYKETLGESLTLLLSIYEIREITHFLLSHAFSTSNK
jgi:hypothetical protein